jgi:hypothetical protein
MENTMMTQTQAAPLPIDTVRAVYADVRRQVADGQCLLHRLLRQYPGCETAGEAASSAVILPSACITGVPLARSEKREVRSEQPAPERRPAARPAAKPARKTAGPTKAEKTAHFEAVARGCAQPFSKAAYIAACGGDPAVAEAAIYRMKARGFLVAHGGGMYSLAAKASLAPSATAASAALLATLRTPQADSQ